MYGIIVFKKPIEIEGRRWGSFELAYMIEDEGRASAGSGPALPYFMSSTR